MVRPLIGQSWLSCLNRGSVGDVGLRWSPNIFISPFTLTVLVQLQQSVLVAGRFCATPVNYTGPANKMDICIWIVYRKIVEMNLKINLMCDRWSDRLQVQVLSCGEVEIKVDMLRVWLGLLITTVPKASLISALLPLIFLLHLSPLLSFHSWSFYLSLFPFSLSHYLNSLPLPRTSRVKPALW